jgi:hypothetical protein
MRKVAVSRLYPIALAACLFSDAIVDFAVHEDRVYVIETNPFDELTGSGLFDYKDDWDVLTGTIAISFFFFFLFLFLFFSEPPDI